MNTPLSSPMPNRSGRVGRTALAAVLLGGVAFAGGFAVDHASAQNAAATTATQPGAPPVNNPAAAAAAHQRLPDFADLVAQVRPAVVSVTNHLKATAAADDEDSEGDGGPMIPGLPFGMMPHPQMHAVEARGSGFIIDANGTIVTNNHVVKDAQTVDVTLDDGTTLPAKVIGTDPRTDVAVLRVSAGHPLPFIQLGDSADVRVGQWVVAMGNPFGLEGTVTAGIVSARGRDIGSGPYDQFIQIDAPINRGNSGGPLFTQDGKVVGINTAILSPSGGSIGIGFAIPSNTVHNVVDQIEATGHVTRGFLGVETQPVSPTMAKALGLPDHNGALVAQVQPDSPAAKAGLRPGDVIRKVGDTAVPSARALAVDVAAVKPGQTVPITLTRGGESQTIQVTVGTMPNEQTADASGDGQSEARGRVGLALAPITPDARQQLNLPDGVSGALIARVQSGSPADKAGLRQGDVIVGVGTESTDSPTAVIKAIRQAEAKKTGAIALRLLRDGQTAFVAVPMPGSKDG
jgi:serine protease Do